ncbi:MAG: hypothetical protein JWP52_1994 [Rhizobacter sp.]|nr:hypothetical protein [Rhizobacter sp.]
MNRERVVQRAAHAYAQRIDLLAKTPRVRTRQLATLDERLVRKRINRNPRPLRFAAINPERKAPPA